MNTTTFHLRYMPGENIVGVSHALLYDESWISNRAWLAGSSHSARRRSLPGAIFRPVVNRKIAALNISNLSNARHLMQVRKTQGTPLRSLALSSYTTASNNDVFPNPVDIQGLRRDRLQRPIHRPSR